MAIKKIKEKIRVVRVEEDSRNYLKVVFSSPVGEYPLKVQSSMYLSFIPGKIYTGFFEVSGMPDFVGQRNEWENICTLNYKLEKILDKNKIIWEEKK